MLQVTAMQRMINMIQQKNALNRLSNQLLTFLSTMEIPPAKLLCAFLIWLPYTANKSSICAAASTRIILFYRVHLSTAEKDSHSLFNRLLIESILSLFQSHAVWEASL